MNKIAYVINGKLFINIMKAVEFTKKLFPNEKSVHEIIDMSYTGIFHKDLENKIKNDLKSNYKDVPDDEMFKVVTAIINLSIIDKE